MPFSLLLNFSGEGIIDLLYFNESNPQGIYTCERISFQYTEAKIMEMKIYVRVFGFRKLELQPI